MSVATDPIPRIHAKPHTTNETQTLLAQPHTQVKPKAPHENPIPSTSGGGSSSLPELFARVRERAP